ncbi:aldo/keto reductase [Flavobacterium oreochromis]|uniref:aldo/keto reductase n=1 Tax=Flavobacterium oreochromis TaxID=2906078 RepID=UPI00385D795B
MNLEKIGFGGSCHWCTEAIFQSLKGVEKVKQGWIRSKNQNQNFSEAIVLYYDPKLISLPLLIEIHLHTHSCTSNHSMREKYRSAIYYFNKNDKEYALNTIKQLQKDFQDKIITQVLPFLEFKLNVQEQLNYYHSNPEKPFCENIINPKLRYLIKNFSKAINTEKLKHLNPSDIGLGTAAVGRPLYINVHNTKIKDHNNILKYKLNGVEFLNKAHSLGITHFDTSPSYGIAEDMLINFLKKNNSPFITISTKWGYTYVANFNENAIQHEVKDHSYQKLITQWEKSKQLLPHLKIYQIHSVTHESNVLENNTILEELFQIKKQYNIEIGLSTSGPYQKEVIKKACQITDNNLPLFTSYQFTYNILDQSIIEIKDLLINKKVIIKEALANGRLLSKEFKHYNLIRERLIELAQKHKTSIDAIAIRFCMDSFPGSITLSGANSIEHLISNLKAKTFELTQDEIKLLKKYTLDPTDYWEERKILKWN